MNRKQIIKIVLVFIICAGTAIAIYFGAIHHFSREKKTIAKKYDSSKIKRKLAYTSDPVQLMQKASDAEALKDWKQALQWYYILLQNLSDTDPRKGMAYHRRAFCFYQLGQYEQAKNTLEFGLNNFPDMPDLDEALFLMAKIYTNLKQYELAYKTYNTIIRMFPARAEEAKQLQSQLPEYSKHEP
jgi:tetratricopeptide (TPR) repeat protein